MNIDSLLDLKIETVAYSSDGTKTSGKVTDVSGDDVFTFIPDGVLNVEAGRLLKISDGKDAILAKVLDVMDSGLRMCIECYASPGNERRQDVRINDKIYYSVSFVSHADRRAEVLPVALEKIRANKLLIDSFLKGQYGYPGSENTPHTREAPYNQAIWELNRKIDLLIHMYLSEDFKNLMGSIPRAVNISASGMRFISEEKFEDGDLLEIGLILPMVPLLYMRFVGEVIRVKGITSYETDRYAVATRFINIENDVRDDIIRYLFRRQREILRRRQDLDQ